MKCKNCGAELEDDALFCDECGNKVEKTEPGTCPSCGFVNTVNAKFCKQCGTKLNEADGAQQQPAFKSDTVANIAETISNAAVGAKNTASNAADNVFENIMSRISDSAEGVEIKNDITCPYCGSDNCDMYVKNSFDIKQKNYSLLNVCIGALFCWPLAPFCGLCGMKQSTSMSNETWYNCKNCGKQHRSPEEASQIARTSAMSAFLVTLACAFFISTQLWSYFTVNVFTFIAAVIPCVMWYMLFHKVQNQLGYPFKLMFSKEDLRKYFRLGLLIIGVTLIFSGIIGVALLRAFYNATEDW